MGELDFVVILPKKGIIVLEIKSHLKIEFVEGEWLYGNDRKSGKNPFTQAREGMFSLRDQLGKRDALILQIPFAHGVCFPSIGFSVQSIEWIESQIIDQSKLAKTGIVKALEKLLSEAIQEGLVDKDFRISPAYLSVECCEELVKFLRPSFEMIPVESCLRDEQNAQLIKLTEQQYSVLDCIEGNPRILLEGPAGTGKTVLTNEALRRAAAQGLRVAYFCYNRNLALEVARAFSGHNKTLIINIDAWLTEITGKCEQKEINDPKRYFGSILPEKAGLAILGNEQLCSSFDMLIIDEAQDLLKSQYLELFDLILKGGLRGGRWMMAGDYTHQVVYSEGNLTIDNFRADYGLTPSIIKLQKNCRNSPEIGTFVAQHSPISPLYSGYLRESYDQDPVPRFFDDEASQLVEVRKTVSRLLESGIAAKEIILLSPFKKQSIGQRLESDPATPFKIREFGQSTRPSVRYSTVHGFKGLESYAVIITDIMSLSKEYERTLFYISSTRALSHLEIFCHRSVKADLRELLLQKHNA